MHACILRRKSPAAQAQQTAPALPWGRADKRTGTHLAFETCSFWQGSRPGSWRTQAMSRTRWSVGSSTLLAGQPTAPASSLVTRVKAIPTRSSSARGISGLACSWTARTGRLK
eukprot:1529112-Prymnesium_polylepis.1